MELVSVEIGLLPIFVVVLLGPLLVKRIERNLEAFLFLMGACAIALSRTWHMSLVEEAIQKPLAVGIMLLVLVAGLILHYHRPHFLDSINGALLDGITLKVLFLEIVVVLGLSSAIITPVLPFFVLVEVVNHLPILHRSRAKLMIMASLSIFLGAAMALTEGPYSTLAITKMQGYIPSENLLSLELQSLCLPCILVLGLLSMFFVEKNVIAMGVWPRQSSAALKNAAIWSFRACMFAGSLVLVGVAFGVSI